jgi:crotonobetainyl-CoA:carnitine CoA-transferase CaiB-like acyl-CoA transferase
VHGGNGQVVDIPLLDPLFAILGAQAANYRLTGELKPRTGSRSTNSATRNVYRTADRRWVCLSASTQGMTEKLFRAMDRESLIADPRFATNTARLEHVEELDAIVGGFIAEMSLERCLSFFDGEGVTVGPVYTMADIENDPHFRQREIVVELPDADMGTVPVHTISPRLGRTPGAFRRAAPALGEHSAEALHEAGYSSEEVESMTSSGLVSTSPPARKMDHA